MAISIDWYVNKTVFSLLTILVVFILSFFFKKVIDFIFLGIKNRLGNQNIMARTRTVRSLIKNIVDFTLLSIAILTILSYWGFNIIPILTGAGILGFAISFGAQTLIKDLINGFFIFAEDQFNVGDRVKIEKFEGEVYKITLRMTILKDKNGNTIYIPNSQIWTIVKLKER